MVGEQQMKGSSGLFISMGDSVLNREKKVFPKPEDEE